MKLVVGLGNPGQEYKLSPHNIGFAVMDELAVRNSVALTRKESHSWCGRFTIAGEEVWLIQPQTFMNLSGVAVRDWLKRKECGPQDLLVVYDELDLPWGTLQIRRGGGAAGHHGVESIIDSIDSREFTRLRMGVYPDRKLEDPVRYLLQPATRMMRPRMAAFVTEGAEATEMILLEGVAKAMNQYNRREPIAD